MSELHCAFCRQPMAYVHGHGACVRSGCPMFGVNQAECCDGETAACPAPTSDVRGAPSFASPAHADREPAAKRR